MRVEYINPFVETAYSILKEVLQGEVRRGDLYLKSTSMPVMGVAALVGLSLIEGKSCFVFIFSPLHPFSNSYVYFDLSLFCNHWYNQSFYFMI